MIAMSPIPRIQITLSNREISEFFFNLFKPTNNQHLVEKFEKEFAKTFDFKHAVAFPRARTAFYFALKNLDLKPGSEVIMSSIHVSDFVNMIILAGFKPVIVDLLPASWAICPKDLENKITENTSALLITHLSGYSNDLKEVIQIARDNNLKIIEDCSQSFATNWNGKGPGYHSDLTYFSLSLLKSVCTLQGGILCTNNDLDYQNIKGDWDKNKIAFSRLELFLNLIKNLILKLATSKIVFQFLTFPFIKISGLLGDLFASYQKTNKTVALRQTFPTAFLRAMSWQQAHLGLSQISKLASVEEKRIANGNLLYNRLKHFQNISFTLPVSCFEKGYINSFWLFPVFVEDPKGFQNFLRKRGIDSSPMLLGTPANEEAFLKFQFSTNQALLNRNKTVFLPNFPDITQDQINQISSMVEEWSKSTEE
jgi:dTDP-4-amino-4,6-dideoxygalactose transaminase